MRVDWSQISYKVSFDPRKENVYKFVYITMVVAMQICGKNTNICCSKNNWKCVNSKFLRK